MSAEQTPRKQPSILVLPKAASVAPQVVAALEEHGDIRAAEQVDEALTALRTGLYDLVLADPADLFPIARVEARQRAELILEQIGQGICIVDHHGTLIWGNARFHAYSGTVVETVRQRCAQACGEFSAGRTKAVSGESRRYTVSIGTEYVFDLTIAPMLVMAKQVQEVVGLVLDVTATHRLQEKVNALDAAGRELVGLDTEALEHLDTGDRLELLEEKINRYAHDLLNFDHFMIRILDRSTNRLETLLSTGLPRETETVPLVASREGNGISGYVAATGSSYICADTSKDPLFLPGLEQAGSSLTVPLLLHDQVVGVMDVESRDTNAFTEDDRQFAEIFGRHIAISLNILQLLAVERSTTTGQLAEDVGAELAAPLDSILASATKAIAAHQGDAALLRQLQEIVSHVDEVKRSLRDLTEKPAIKGLMPESALKDPLASGKRILVAEDEDIIRETIADVLAKSGALPVMARDGQEAIAMVQAQHFDLVVSDIKMPYKNGYEVFEAVRQTDRHCPVILVTGFGYDPDHCIVRASKEGLAAVLFKPFKVDELMDAVHQALMPEK